MSTQHLEKKKSFTEKAKDEVKEFGRKLSDVAKNYPDDGNMSSETKIRPNREGPSPLDKINEKYADTVGKVEQEIEKVEEKVGETVSNTPSS